MLNSVRIIGRLGKDPELKYSATGTPICNFNVATDESYKDKDGQKVERTEWHRIVCYQKLAENCGKFLDKGSLVFIDGSLTTRKWQDQQGQDRYTTEIKAHSVQFLDRKNAADGQQATTQGHLTGMPMSGGSGEPVSSGMDDVPF